MGVIETNDTAYIMKSQRMKQQVLKETGEKWKKAGILLGSSEDYVIRDLE